MRTALIASLVMLVAVPMGWAATRPAPGTLSIEDVRGAVLVRGTGTVVGRLDRGELQITDLSPNDAWTPKVNGVAKARTVVTRGRDINFFVPGGRYRVTVKGDGVSLSARGVGVATVKGARTGEGTFAVGDAPPTQVTVDSTRLTFGGDETGTG